jgi:plasmid stability protein
MVNVTITLDEETLKRVRIHALHEGTSLNAIVRTYLERLVGSDPAKDAGERLAEIAGESVASSGVEGRTWVREDLYDR